jgi:hypothetical protein
MTSYTNSRYGLTFVLAIAMTAAIAVAGSVWAKGNGQQSAIVTEQIRIDVSALHAGADIANFPVVYVAEPF